MLESVMAYRKKIFDWESKNISKKLIPIGCFFFFMIWRIILIVHYEGWYAYDETYHISSSNSEFYDTSLYYGATYIGDIIHWLSGCIGKSYYVYKSIPFVLSCVSIGALLYVLCHVTAHTYSVLIFTFIVSFHGVIIFNHLYIREYIWDEAVYSSLVFLLYRMQCEKQQIKRIGLGILYIVLAFALAIIQSWYSIAVGLMLFAISAFAINTIFKIYLQKLKELHYIRMAVWIALGLLGILMAALIANRLGVISLPVPEFMDKILNIYGDYWGYPYFARNFYYGGIGLVIGAIIYGHYMVKRVNNHSDNMIGIYCLGIIPVIVLNVLYFDCCPVRVYASYLPTFVFIAVLGFDIISTHLFYKCLILLFSIFAVLKPEAEMDIKEYIQVPYLWNETNFNNYGGLIGEAQTAISNGRKCICIWSDEHEAAAFPLDAEYTIALNNSNNISNGYTEEDLSKLLCYLQKVEEPYAVMIGTHSDWKLNEIKEDFLAELLDIYPYSEYERRAYLFYIN